MIIFYTVTYNYLTLMHMAFLSGCGSTTLWDADNPSEVTKVHAACSPHGVTHTALAFGLMTVVLVQCAGHISGSHMNPAVTVAMLVTRNVTLLRGVFYVLAQCLGGLAGAGILYGVTPYDVITTLGATQVHTQMALGQAFGVEFMITFILVFTVFANMDPKRIHSGSRALAVGFAVAVGHLFAVRLAFIFSW